MAKNLVIVESPAKARTIERYLGKGFRVQASMGHVRDLPPKKLGVDIENDFEPTYQLLRGKTKAVNALKKAAKAAGDVYMATDLDREGEAIAWHLCEALGLEPEAVKRVVFNEITRGAIQRAFSEPGRIDMDKVSAQEARRILDRLVGYKLSPLLWKKIAKGLSAGRVQSVAVRLIVEREREIRDFRPEESWRITAHLHRPDDERVFKAALAEVDAEKFAAQNETEAKAVVEALGKAAYAVRSVEKKRTKDRPPPPFITSHLQRTASTRLSFSTKKTMTLAQRLYQGVELGSEGSVALITYMRTDSHRVAPSAQAAARDLIGSRFGENYLPDEAPHYRSKGRAQEAHEAIRPTDVARTPESVKGHLGRDEARLYELIWNRFVASQMRPALWDVTDVQVEARADAMTGLFKARGRTLVFDGYTKVAGVRMSKDDQELPPLADGDGLDLEKLEPTQHFSQPPARYNEASLVRKLEELGIGRPSTYASIVSTIQERGYTEQKKNLFLRCARHPKCQYTVPCDLAGKPIGPEVREAPTHDASAESQSGVPTNGTTWLCNACDAEMEQKTGRRCFYATQLGEVVTDKLVAHFPTIMDTGFTSHMEDELDDVEEAKSDWLEVVREFWGPFSEALERASDEMESAKNEVAEDAGPCPDCGGNLVKRWSKRGPFLGCSNYPECKFTRPLEGEARPEPQATEHECEKCGGKMLLREGRRGPFLGCENFPKCRNTLPVDAEGNPVRPEPTGETCDKCGAEMVIRSGRRGKFLACSAFPKCRNTKPLPDELKAKGGKGGGKRSSAKRGASGGKGGAGKSGGGRKKAVETDRECPDCGQTLVIRRGRRGPFLGCSGYPKCRHTEDVPPDLQDAVEGS